MIVEYHRPETIAAALELLARPQPVTVPLGGGTALNAPGGHPDEPLAVVDLQALGLDGILRRGGGFVLGAAARLQSLLDFGELPTALNQAVRLEATHNLRGSATVAGTVVTAAGRSPLVTALLALDAALTVQPGRETLQLGELLPLPDRHERLQRRLITAITMPANARLAYHQVARTPADRPLVCAAAAAWPSGRVRVALGGFGPAPRLAFDGDSPDGAADAARSAYAAAGDEWASAEYRQEIAAVLVSRCIDEIGG